VMCPVRLSKVVEGMDVEVASFGPIDG
jgi:hypothetical protein